MASGSGHVYYYRKPRSSGRLYCCDGAFPGTALAFKLSDCTTSLRTKIRAKNISVTRDCPSPEGSIEVAFDFGIGDGEIRAVNVRNA